MSGENVTVVRELLDAFRCRDHRGVRDYWAEWLDAWEEIEFETPELIDSGADVVVVGFRQRQKGRGSGIWVDVDPWWGVYRLKDGKLARFFASWDRDEALRVAGLV